MKFRKTARPLLLLAALMLLALTMTGCVTGSTKPTVKDFAPKGGCSERTAGLSFPPPPPTEDLFDWKQAYLEGARAHSSVVNLRIVTADCLDSHRNPPKWYHLWRKK